MNTKCKFKVGDKVVNVCRAHTSPLFSDHWYGTNEEMVVWELSKTELEVTRVIVDSTDHPDHWRVEVAEKVGRKAYWYHEDELDFAPQKPKLTLPLQVGQRVNVLDQTGCASVARVVDTDYMCRGHDEPARVLVIMTPRHGEEEIIVFNKDGTHDSHYIWLSDPPDPREDLIPGQAIFVRDRDTDNWSIRLFHRVDPDGPGVFVTALGTECGDLVSYRYWKPYVAPTKELNVETGNHEH